VIVSSRIPKNNWAVKLLKDWSAHRQLVCPSHTDWPTHLLLTQPKELDYWLSKFVLEVRKANGDYQRLCTIIICSGLFRHNREDRPEIDIF
jgi:hypothetical protein